MEELQEICALRRTDGGKLSRGASSDVQFPYAGVDIPNVFA
jgi:hypothetical protein